MQASVSEAAPADVRKLLTPETVRNGRERRAPRVALVSGFWGQNIGNAYFNVGGRWILESVFGPEAVGWIQDQPGYATFHDQSRGNHRRDLNLLRYLDVDYVVLEGPCLTETFGSLWSETFRALRERGVRIILLGAAFFRYTDREIAAARAVLAEYAPAIIVTRDSATYAHVKDMAPHVYDGIDSAFFVPCAHAPFDLTTPPFVTFTFDRYPEPRIAVQPKGVGGGANRFEWWDRDWEMTFPKMQRWFSNAGKATAYIGHALDRRKLPAFIADHIIVRPEHRSNPRIEWKIYRHPNAVVSDEPFTYFTLYANTQLTLSDRVHACVVTLAYGRPAMLFTPSPRAALFERLGLTDIKRRPVSLDASYLRNEWAKELEFLKNAVRLLDCHPEYAERTRVAS